MQPNPWRAGARPHDRPLPGPRGRGHPGSPAGRRPPAAGPTRWPTPPSAALAALGQRPACRRRRRPACWHRATRRSWRPRPAFAQARLAVASLAAPRAGVDPAALDAVWAATTDQRMTAVLRRAVAGRRALPRLQGHPRASASTARASRRTRGAWPACRLPRSSSGPDRAGHASRSTAVAARRPRAVPRPRDDVPRPRPAIVHAPRTGQTVEVKAWSKARRVGSPAEPGRLTARRLRPRRAASADAM